MNNLLKEQSKIMKLPNNTWYLKIKHGDCATADGAERKGYTYEKELMAE